MSGFKEAQVRELQKDGRGCHYDRESLKSSLRGGPTCKISKGEVFTMSLLITYFDTLVSKVLL